MAGDHQHILPRFLLNGFASRTAAKKCFSWVFRKDTRPKEISTKDIGVVTRFYGTPRETDADTPITALEGELASWVNAWRTESNGHSADITKSARLVGHFMVRSQVLRENFVESARVLVQQLRSRLADGDQRLYEKLVLKQIASHPESILEAVRAKASPFAPKDTKEILKLIAPQLPVLVRQLGPQLRSLADNYVQQFEAALPETAKKSHNQALIDSELIPLLRERELSALFWEIMVCRPHTFILGDAGPIARTAGRLPWKNLTEPSDMIEEVCLPLSDTHLLIGTNGQGGRQTDPGAINEASARCSPKHFIATQCTVREEGYQRLLGEWSTPLAPQTLMEIADEVLADASSLN